LGALACSVVVLLLSGGTGKPMETTLQDDAQFLHRPAAQVRATARRVAALGADRVRLTAGWSALSPRPRSRRVPGAPFDASDSATYPRGSWTALDTAVKAVDDAGLKAQIDVGFWAPRWAVQRPSPNGRGRWRPDPELFGDFATAVARRYSGGFRDPADRTHRLPAVRMYTPWNEPNHPSFLAPQWIDDPARGRRPESPHVYRAMYEAAYDAIKAVSPLDQVLLGGTSASGSTVAGQGGVPPLRFVRELACVDAALAPLDVPECRNFKPLRADGFAHHPYSRTTVPGASSPAPDDVPLADVDRLERLLGELAARGRITSSLGLYLTEYGYESRQDDPFAPFDRAHQAEFMGWSSYLAWRDPNTRMFAQFLLRDIDPSESGHTRGTRSYYRDWQSGLYDAAGEPKPAAQAFKLPFWVQTDAGKGVLVAWGAVRPNHGAETVRVERRVLGGTWYAVQTWGSTCDPGDRAFLTDREGVFQRALPAAAGPADYRFSWRRPDGVWEASEGIRLDVPAT
jgi:hypothetical protein